MSWTQLAVFITMLLLSSLFICYPAWFLPFYCYNCCLGEQVLSLSLPLVVLVQTLLTPLFHTEDQVVAGVLGR